MNKRHLLFAALLLVSALALAACGGSGGNDEEGEIESAIETSATTADPANCTDLETLAFVEQNANKKGAAAIADCKKEAKDDSGKADSVDVSEIEIDGSRATANVKVSGGSLDGQTVTIALVEEGGWKLDQITGFADLRVDGIVSALRDQLEESSALNEEQVECILGEIEAADESDLEELVLNGSAPQIEADVEHCE